MDVVRLVGDLVAGEDGSAWLSGDEFELPVHSDAELDELIEGRAPTASGTPSFPRRFLDRIASAVAPDDRDTVLRLTLRSADPQLLGLEWELTKVTFAGQQRAIAAHKRLSLMREVTSDTTPQGPAPRTMTPHAVLVVCLPNAEKKTAELNAALAEAGYTVDVCEDADLTLVSEAMATPAALVCFLGHGEPDGLLLRNGVESSAAFAKAISRNHADLVLLLSCESAAENASHGGSVARHLAEAGVRVVVGMQRKLPDDAAMAYAKALFQRWAKGGAVDDALLAGRKALVGPDMAALAFVPVAYTSPQGDELSRLRIPRRAAGRRVECDLLSCEWPLKADPPGSFVRRRFDTFLALNRDVFTEVVADLSDVQVPLAEELNVAELDLEHDLAVDGVEALQWFDLGPRRLGESTGVEEVKRRLLLDNSGWTSAYVDGSGSRMGFVLGVEALEESLRRFEPEITSVKRLQSLFPGAAVIVHCTAARPGRAVAWAWNFGTRMGMRHIMVARPEQLQHASVRGTGGLRAVVALVDDEMGDLGFDWLGGRFEEGDIRGLPRPVRVIRDLNGAGIALADEVRFLRAVRALFPTYYLPLLTQHASHREEAGVWAGLVAAADDAEHLKEWWLDGRHRVAHRPFPPGLIAPDCVESVLVQLLADGAPRAAVERWLQRGGRVAHDVFAMVSETSVGWELDFARATASTGAVAELAARVAARLGVRPVHVDQAVGRPFFWALAGRTGLVELVSSLSARTKALLTESIGSLPDSNLEELERREQLRDALWSPGSRK